MLTNKGLVEFAKKALAEKWGYVWGTFGLTLTKTLLQQKLNQYPKEVGQYKDFIMANWLNRKTADCIGLIKGYYWSKEDGKILYNPATDVNANQMFNLATAKGTIDTMPEIPGICVYKQGHIGVYIGNGQIIEARGTKEGVIQTPLKGTNSAGWTHWLKCPYIEYEQEIPKSILKYGSKGEDVKLLQGKLNTLGYQLIVDGHYGIITQGAVRDFQRECGFTGKDIDGIVGPKTWAKLYSKDSSQPKPRYYIEGITHVVELEPKDLRISVEDKPANKITLENFVTSGFQLEQAEKTTLPVFPTSLELIQKGKYYAYPVGILVSEGHIIQNRQPHGKAAGTLIVYKNGNVECKPILNLLTETDYNSIWFAVSGCSILPKIRMVEEGFVGKFADIGRVCARPVIGYRKKDNKIIIAVRNDSNIGRGRQTLINLGCDFGITLDAGGSTVLRVNGLNKFKSTRRLFSVITW
jgi:hypothetical protein